MINRDEFKEYANRFRTGRIDLNEFMAAVFTDSEYEPSDDSLESELIHLRLPVRPENSHKGDFGRVLLIGGSAEMPGAIAMAGLAALRTGAGLVAVVTPDEARGIVASFSPCLMTCGVESKDGCFASSSATRLLEKCDWADVVAIGPGMGTTKACQKIVSSIYQHLPKPVVLDADAINCLAAGRAEGASRTDLTQHAGARIFTPHPVEFERLTGRKFKRRAEMEDYAIETARRTEAVVVLKGPKSLVTDGTRIYRNQTGNQGMATGGSGDVLTGMIASLVGQKMTAFESAQNSCYLHGLAGDVYAEQSSAASLIATDLIEQLPAAMERLSKAR